MDLEKIRELVKMVEESEVTGLTIEEGETKIEIEKFAPAQAATVMAPQPVVAMSSPAAASENSSPDANADSNSGLSSVASPMTGTFYSAGSPDAPPFVKAGDHISKGQVVCIVEAMKSFNEIESEISGIVEKVLVENGQGVELDQPLILVKEQ